MELREFFSEDAVKLELEGTTKDEVLKELIGLLKLEEKSEGMLFKMLKRRENLGSTGIGRRIAVTTSGPQSVTKVRAPPRRRTVARSAPRPAAPSLSPSCAPPSGGRPAAWTSARSTRSRCTSASS